MKKITLLIASLLLAASAAVAAPLHEGHVQKVKPKTAKKVVRMSQSIVTGYISDSHCGLMHMGGMGDEQSCTLKCVEGGGKFVLADHAKKVVYNLDSAGQKKAREFAGREVKVTGHVAGKTIHVTNIEAAS